MKYWFQKWVVLLVSCLLYGAPVFAELVVGELTLVSKTRASRTDFSYTYQVNIANTGAEDFQNVSATVTSSFPQTTIVDGDIAFGTVDAGTTVTSSDTFTFRQNRRFPFVPNSLTYDIRSTLADTVAPVVTVTSPANLDLFNTSTVSVSGTVDDPQANLTVNGIAAVVNDGNFTVAGVALQEGNTVIAAIATDPAGNAGIASVEVVRDTVPPTLAIETPQDGSITSVAKVDVAGLVNDIANGTTINADDVRVSVNGVDASVSNRTFILADVSLRRGPNTVTATAWDRAGNESSASVQVTLQELAGQHVERVSGNNQTGVIDTTLPQPLIVKLVDDAGNPLAGRHVNFEVARGNGQLDGQSYEGQEISLTTDANGLASASFTLGNRVGAGNHRVVATAVGFVGQADFCATAINAAPVRITTIAGDRQIGVIGQPLGNPFKVMVTDSGGNPVGGVDVAFTVTRGEGNIGGQTTVAVPTDLDGLAAVTFTLGPDAGVYNNAVTASFAGLAEAAATATASGTEAATAAATSFSGIVLDNQDIPVPGVTVHIEAEGPVLDPIPTAVTDEQGRFLISGAPVGPVTLVVNGGTATRPGDWITLAFETDLIPGLENILGMPIYLLPVADNAVVVQNGGPPQNITLLMPNMPGAEVTIRANSVTCPPGQNECTVSWTQINAERMAMPPPMGSVVMLGWTMQPKGAIFDPPVDICIPNMDQPPGTQIEMFNWSYDLADWAPIGTATVKKDGSQLCSDPGYGIPSAGWGCCVEPPKPKTCVASCGACMTCDLNQGICVPVPGCTDTDGDQMPDDQDPDDDNDGVIDADELANNTDPLNPDVCGDSDNDTCDDCAIGTDDFGSLSDVDPSNDGPDYDMDGMCDLGDNCPMANNPTQTDSDNDGRGDTCTISNLVLSDDLWYFGGAQPSTYSTEITIIADNLQSDAIQNGTFTWEVITGKSTVSFSNGGDTITVSGQGLSNNSIKLESTGKSTAGPGNTKTGDVTIQLTFDGLSVKNPSGPQVVSQTLDVSAPTRLVKPPVNDTHEAGKLPFFGTDCAVDAGGIDGYVSKIYYQVLSQFNDPVGNVDINETFDVTTRNNCVLNDWPVPNEKSGVTNNIGIFFDNIAMCAKGPIGGLDPLPIPPENPLSLLKVDDIVQSINVGSSVAGEGIKVSSHLFTRFADHGEHRSLGSPAGCINWWP